MYSNDGKNKTKTNEFALMDALKNKNIFSRPATFYYKMILWQIFML